MESGSWDAKESSRVAHCKRELAERQRSDFKKKRTKIRNFTNPTDNTVKKMNGEVDEVASEGERLRLRFYEDRG
jgi:hypothetical protein